MPFALAFLLAVVWTPPVAAETAEGWYAILGHGARICERFLDTQAADPSVSSDYAIWVSGYLTARNRDARDTYDLAGPFDFERIMGWLRSHCRERPDETLAAAVEAFIAAYHDERLRRP